eukprot:3417705-Heterocapsa_arctica.AAC.1
MGTPGVNEPEVDHLTICSGRSSLKLLIISTTTTRLIRASGTCFIGLANRKRGVKTDIVKVIARVLRDTGGIVAGNGICNHTS